MCQYYTKKTDRRPYEKFADGKTVCIEDEIPFDLPNGWAWARIGDVFDLQAGKNIKADCIYEQASPGHPFACFGGNGIRGYVGSSNVQGIHAIIGRQGALCGNLNLSTEKFYATEHAVVVTTFANTEALFAFHFLKAMNLNRLATATAQPGLSVAIVNQSLMPIPPLAEQKRIAAKIMELFAESDTIAAAEDGLACTAERINKKVLDLAIRGQLVPQDPNDEPAEKLLQRIAEARQHSANMKSRKLKSEGSVIFYGADRSAYETRNGKTVCIDDEIPFLIPGSWVWIRFGVLIDIIAGVSYQKDDVTTTGVRILRGGNIKEDAHIYINNEDVFLSQQYADSATTIRKGDVVIVASTGSSTVIGRPAIASADMPSVQIGAFLRILRAKDESVREWLPVIVLGDYYRKHIREQSKGTNIKNLKAEYLNEMLIPLPPIAEQKRIVAKIEEVRKLTQSLTM